MEFDVLIRGGLLYDGSGRPPEKQDIGVVGDRIEAIGDLSAATGSQQIDAAGLAIAPGFIDTHTHSDVACLLPDEHREIAGAAVRQGVTTEIAGNCGFSTFPFVPSHKLDAAEHLSVLFGPSCTGWHDLASYAAAASAAGLVGNMATLVGLGSLRAGVVGLSNRPASDEELRTMRRLLDKSLEEGVLGISSGLIYAPGVYASTSELIQMVKPLPKFGRPYVTHVRGETDMVADSIREAIDIGRAASVPLHISHHKVAGKQNWGRTEETLGIMERARSSGIELTIDVYPYTAGSTLLHSVLPLWVQDGGVSQMVDRLRDSAVRDRIRENFKTGLPGWQNLYQAAGWEGIVIANCLGRPEIENKSIEQLADAAGKDPTDYVFDLVIAQRDQVLIICHILSEADVRQVVASDAAMIGSDGIPLPGKPHPRWAGTFSRILGRYCRENGLIDLSTAIRKMTSFPAQRFSLSRRGTVAKGNFADLVLFDPNTVVDRATYEEPLLPPVGVQHVFVNGIAAVSTGALTGAKAGKFLTPG